MDNPFDFVWGVDQDGYELKRVKDVGFGSLGRALAALDDSNFNEGYEPFSEYLVVAGCGGPIRYYRPLDNDGLWLRFAENCRHPDGVLQFANEFGSFRCPDRLGGKMIPDTPLIEFLNTSEHLWDVAGRLRSGDRSSAADIFGLSASRLPSMKVTLFPRLKSPGTFEYKFVPNSFRDALLYQAAEAIAGNRVFQRCRNEKCPNWFRLGPRAASDGGNKTYTIRREFCSDRCRVAAARRAKRGAVADT